MRTSNPTINAQIFEKEAGARGLGQSMTVQGTVVKTGILLLCVLLSASYTWSLFAQTGDAAAVMGWAMIGGIGGFIMAMVTFFKKEWSAVTAPVYSVFQGLALGGISAIIGAQYEGIVMQAVGLTFGTCAAMLMCYQTGLIKVTDGFRMGIVAATGGIALVYMASFVMSFFGMSMPFIHDSGMAGILFSVFVVAIAALNLVLDFDLIETGERVGAPKYMEWYGAFALMVTLIWLYMEILRLLMKLRDRR